MTTTHTARSLWIHILTLRLALTASVIPTLLVSHQPPSTLNCGMRWLLNPRDIVSCLGVRGVLSTADQDSADQAFYSVLRLRDSLQRIPSNATFESAAQVTRALAHMSEFYSRGLLDDSARFHRVLDHILVSAEYARGTIPRAPDGRLWPRTTPYLSWVYYPGYGIYFQPVTTTHSIAYLIPRSNSPTDSVLGFAESAYRYALWRSNDGHRFPVWEYEYTSNAGTITNTPPWVSSQAQAGMLTLFAEAYQRTQNPVWRARAFEVLESFRVDWDSGGILLSDTTHGYWWEQYNPLVQVWNGAAQAVVGVGYFYQVTHDPDAKRMFDRGIEALKFNTPKFDTGHWTLYSLTHGYNSAAYHTGSIEILDALFTLSGDPWFKVTADRWRTYVPPTGVH